MSAGLDTRQVRHAFGRAAATYEAHAVLQAEVGTRLLERLDGIELKPDRVLDVGSGPGRGADALRTRFPSASVVALDIALPMLRAATTYIGQPPAFARVGADAQALPFADAAFDLIHSNLCLQWCDDPGLAIVEFARVLKPGGMAFVEIGDSALGTYVVPGDEAIRKGAERAKLVVTATAAEERPNFYGKNRRETREEHLLMLTKPA